MAAAASAAVGNDLTGDDTEHLFLLESCRCSSGRDCEEYVKLVEVTSVGGRYLRPVTLDISAATDARSARDEGCYRQFESYILEQLHRDGDQLDDEQFVLQCKVGTVLVKKGGHQDNTVVTVRDLSAAATRQHNFWSANALQREWQDYSSRQRTRDRSEKPSKELVAEMKEFRNLPSLCFHPLVVNRVKRRAFEKFLSSKGYDGKESQVYLDVYVKGIINHGDVALTPDFTFSRCEYDVSPCCSVNILHNAPVANVNHMKAYDLQFTLYKSRPSQSSIGERQRIGKRISYSCPYNRFVPPVSVDLPPVGLQSLCSMIHCVDIEPAYVDQVSSVSVVEELKHVSTHTQLPSQESPSSGYKPVIMIERITRYQNALDGIFQTANRTMNSYVYMVLSVGDVNSMETAVLKRFINEFYVFCKELRNIFENFDTLLP